MSTSAASLASDGGGAIPDEVMVEDTDWRSLSQSISRSLTTNAIVCSSRLISQEEFCRLHRLAVDQRTGQIINQKIFHDLMLANFRLVWKMALRVSRMLPSGSMLEPDDLFHVGVIGLEVALHKVDLSRGAFSTYATWWIRQKILRYVEDAGTTIRLPVHIVTKVRRMRRMYAILLNELGCEPSDSQVARALGIDQETLLEWRDYQQIGWSVNSLDEPLPQTPTRGWHSDEDAMELGALLADHSDYGDDPGSDDRLEQIDQRQMLDRVIAHADLTLREGAVVAYRFGFVTGGVQSLEEVGRRLGVTRERIRQIQVRALQKLIDGARRAGYGEELLVRALRLAGSRVVGPPRRQSTRDSGGHRGHRGGGGGVERGKAAS